MARQVDQQSGEFELYLDGMTIETTGTFEIASEWYDGELDGHEAKLLSWKVGDRSFTREQILLFTGEESLRAIEERFSDEWAETAEANARDQGADYARDYRMEDDFEMA